MKFINCLHCGKDHLVKYIGKYCSFACQHEYRRKQKIDNWLTCGVVLDIRQIRRYLLENRPHKCEVCKRVRWNKKPITLEIEHIDGNSNNNCLSNLLLICPNCHSQTPTYKSKNRGNGRHQRRDRYKEGKSF